MSTNWSELEAGWGAEEEGSQGSSDLFFFTVLTGLEKLKMYIYKHTHIQKLTFLIGEGT